MNSLIFILLICASKSLCNKWIDPHEMNTNTKLKLSEIKKRSVSSPEIKLNTDDFIEAELFEANLKRTISILMHSAHFDKTDPEEYRGHIKFKVTPSDFEFLLGFSKQDNLSLSSLRQLNTVLSNSFNKSLSYEYLDNVEHYQSKLYSIIFHIYNLWFLCALFLLYVVFQLVRNDFSLFYIFKYLLVLVLIVDFTFRYHYLLEEAEEHNMNVLYSQECDTSKMSWFQWFKYSINAKDCKKQIVTPLDAFLYQLENLIIVPMKAFGTGMGSFGRNMFTTLPWGVNLILWPVLLLFTLYFVVFVITIFTGQSIEFNLFHLIKLKFDGNSSGTKNFEKLLDRLHQREVIQNINLTVKHDKNFTSPNKSIQGKPELHVEMTKSITSSKSNEELTTNGNIEKNKLNKAVKRTAQIKKNDHERKKSI